MRLEAILAAILIICIVSLSSGCSALDSAVDKGAELNDEALETAELAICRAASIGSILRRYRTEEQVSAWQGLCLPKVDNLILVQPTEQ